MTGLTVIFVLKRAGVWCEPVGRIQVLPPSFAGNRDVLAALKLLMRSALQANLGGTASNFVPCFWGRGLFFCRPESAGPLRHEPSAHVGLRPAYPTVKNIKNKGLEIVPVSNLIYKDNYKINSNGTQINK